MYLIPLPPYLRSTFSSVSFSHLWFTSFISFSIWRLCCLSSIWKLLSWRFDSFWEQKSLIKSHFLHSVRHCEQLFWPFSSHFVMHSVQVNLWQKLLFLHQLHKYQFGCGVSKMVGPKKQGFCLKINMLKGNFDTNYFEPLMILSS